MELRAGKCLAVLGAMALAAAILPGTQAEALGVESDASPDTTTMAAAGPARKAADSALALIARLEFGRTASQADLEPLLADPSAEVRIRAALAAGRLAPAGAAGPLTATLGDPEPAVRWMGAFALGQTGDREALAPLVTATSDAEPKVAAQAADALSRLGHPEAGATLARLLSAPEPRVRRAAALGLSRLADSTYAGDLVSALKVESDAQAAAGILEALEKMPRQTPAALIVPQLESPSPLVRAPAARTLGKTGDRATATSPLVSALADREWRVRVNSARALGELRARGAAEPLIKLLKDPVHHVRESAAIALGEIGDEAATEPLVRASTDDSPGVRRAAVTAIGAILGAHSRATLTTRMEDSAPQVSAAALTALGAAAGADAIPRAIERTDPGQPSLMRLAAIGVLAEAGLPETNAVLRDLVTDEDWVIAATAAEALAENGDREAEDALLETAARSADFEATEARLAALAALGRIGTERASGMLLRALSDPDPRVRSAAIECTDSLAVRGVRLDQHLRSAVTAEEKRIAQGERRSAAFLGPTPAEFPPIPPPREHEARLVTPRGTIMITLFTDVAPVAVANFVRLARSGFYDHGAFHRVVPNFVVQGGCPRHDGYGGPGYALPAEISPEEYSVGTLGMADAGLDTAGSQFFLTLSPTPRLEGRYTAFGRVTAGLAVLEQIQIGDWFRVEIIPPDSEAPGSEGASERGSDAR